MYSDIIKNFIDVEEKFILMWLGCYYQSFMTMCNKYGLLHGIHHSELEYIGLNFFENSAFGDSKNWERTFKNAVEIEPNN